MNLVEFETNQILGKHFTLSKKFDRINVFMFEDNGWEYEIVRHPGDDGVETNFRMTVSYKLSVAWETVGKIAWSRISFEKFNSVFEEWFEKLLFLARTSGIGTKKESDIRHLLTELRIACET